MSPIHFNRHTFPSITTPLGLSKPFTVLQRCKPSHLISLDLTSHHDLLLLLLHVVNSVLSLDDLLS